ncbi:hypothetical protein D3C81_1719150 [compost metagenome]
MDHRRTCTEVISAVLSGQRVHRVRPELPVLSSADNRAVNILLHFNLVDAYRGMNDKSRHPRILTDRRYLKLGHADILRNRG